MTIAVRRIRHRASSSSGPCPVGSPGGADGAPLQPGVDLMAGLDSV